MASLTLDQIIHTKDISFTFVAYLNRIHAQEGLEFWLEVELFRRVTECEECMRAAKRIYSRFLGGSSRAEINIDGAVKDQVRDIMARTIYDQHLFDNAQKSVYETLNFTCVRDFCAETKLNKKKKKESRILEVPNEGLLLLLEKYQDLVKAEKESSGEVEKEKKLSLTQRFRNTTIFKKKNRDRGAHVKEVHQKRISGPVRRYSDAGDGMRPVSLVRPTGSPSLGFKDDLMNMKKCASAPIWMMDAYQS